MEYHSPWWLKNGHLQSIYPSLFRKVDDSFYVRERIPTPDHDFIDIDWARNGNERIVIITHGLEGHSRRPYVSGMARAALDNNWDALAWNFRSCGSEPNKKLASYHSGQTHDLHLAVQTAIAHGYKEIALVGFSIGGNKTLLYLGRENKIVPPEVLGAVTFSVPLELSSSSSQLAKPQNRLYMINFLSSFKEKFKAKNKLHDGAIDLSGFNKIKTFEVFDNRYTAPMNGFSDAREYWRYSSSLYQLANIERPTLLVNAIDDPFLTPECFPESISKNHPYFQFESTRHGGHVGFMPKSKNQRYWSEERAFQYLNELSQV